MKIRIMSHAVLFAVVFSLLLSATSVAAPAKPTFQDVPATHWAYAAIEEAYADKVVNGTSANPPKYSPENALTVGQWIAIMARAFYPADVAANPKPTQYSAWNYPEIAAGLQHHMLDGITYYPGGNAATRYEMAVIVSNIMKDAGLLLSSTEVNAMSSKIADWKSIPAEYKTAVATAYKYGILQGVDAKGTFNGNGTLKRSHAATVYVRTKNTLAAAGIKPQNPSTPSNPGTSTVNPGTTNPGTTNPGTTDPTPSTTPSTDTSDLIVEGRPAATASEAEWKAYAEKVLEALEEKYPSGTPWYHESYTSHFSPAFNSTGTECAGWAFMVSDAIFGNSTTMPKYKVTDWNKIRVGDVINYITNGKSTHWGVVTAVGKRNDGETCFWSCEGNSDKEVAWSDTSFAGVRVSEYQGSSCVLWSRYPR